MPSAYVIVRGKCDKGVFVFVADESRCRYRWFWNRDEKNLYGRPDMDYFWLLVLLLVSRAMPQVEFVDQEVLRLGGVKLSMFS